jgi:hypothetical protein
MLYQNLVISTVCLVLWLFPTTPQNRPSGQAFCESVRALLQASYSNFNGIKRNVVRHSDGATDWVPSIIVAGTSECEGQSDPIASSSVSCTGAVSQSLDDLEPIYQSAVRQLRSCLDQSFVFSESQGGKATRLATPIKESSFEVKSKDEGPDGPGVRIVLQQWHSSRRTDYEIEIWIDAKGKD